MIRDYDSWKLATPPGFGEDDFKTSDEKGMKVGSKKYKAHMKEVNEIGERTGWNKYLREVKQRQSELTHQKIKI